MFPLPVSTKFCKRRFQKLSTPGPPYLTLAVPTSATPSQPYKVCFVPIAPPSLTLLNTEEYRVPSSPHPPLAILPRLTKSNGKCLSCPKHACKSCSNPFA